MSYPGRSPVAWAAVFGGGMALIAWLEYRDAIVMPWNLVLVALFSCALIPMARAANNRAASCGVMSPALRAYNRRSLHWSLAYVVALGIAVTTRNNLHPQGPLLWLIAVLPSLPILYFIWAMARYLAEETDEYLRQRQALAGMIATGLLLGVATFWGFLETFGLVPHAFGWAAVPVWAIGLGLGNLLLSRRDRQDADR
ncbi:hypothetical protein [Novosphingobium sp. B 225]|uniref:hypothetical protein n=1 Tax=Novosphingobium sp. B 225 TaxID=1961849 RepID=UPI001124F310|nr:hypothetical protein [Novosphingobium sp. B 225]